ncbi:aspartate aminotransferase family protein [Streptomyces sp. 5-6(2022)]|uniref:pyridoxal phosphate-dependent decarboxylase family protein n=1 Tax=Streptomyces sp. 5-6(2022) TaxID=2936510 RepID=UPI0023B94FB5|nr:aspartate aminotransferase family protein [Streptomyces sp. 5-6(2022)]
MDGRANLLNERTLDHYQSSISAGAERVARSIAAAKHPFSGISPDELSSVVGAIDLDTPLGDVQAALDELERVYLRDTVYFHHPRYLAHLNCPVVIPAVVGEAVLSAVNSSLDTWDQSGAGTLIERRLIDWAAQRAGLGPAADGVFTSGGTQSNLQAMLLAREETCHLAARSGDPRLSRAEMLPRLRVLTSQCSHFSIAKSATLLGLAEDATITVACDGSRRMTMEALAAQIARCRSEGLLPMAVVATAGTTDFGSIDPLHDIADLCARERIWMHVDAAYGCGVLASRRHRALLRGVERADSVTMDFHKSFFQPISSSALLVRDRTTLRHATYHADYLNPRSVHEHVPNQVDKSIQTTRRFDALKLWMTLRIIGADAVGELFDEVVERAGDAWRLLDSDPRFEVVTTPQLSTLVFRYVPGPDTNVTQAVTDEANLYARKTLASDGDAVVAATVVDGRHFLKFTLLNPATSLNDIATVLHLVATHAQRYMDRIAGQGQAIGSGRAPAS